MLSRREGHVPGSGWCIGLHFNIVLLPSVRGTVRHSESHPSSRSSASLRSARPSRRTNYLLTRWPINYFRHDAHRETGGGHPSSVRAPSCTGGADNFCVTKCRGCHARRVADPGIVRGPREPSACPRDFVLLSRRLELI